MTSQIDKLLQKAANAVKDLPEVIQPAAFNIAFKELAKEDSTLKVDECQNVEEHRDNQKGFFVKMSKESGIEIMNLKAIYRLNAQGKLNMVVSLSGTTAEKQRTLAYLYLYACRVGEDRDWVSALEFAKQADLYGINDGHISKNIKIEKGFILQSGTKRGVEYGLTPNGVVKAKETIKNLQ